MKTSKAKFEAKVEFLPRRSGYAQAGIPKALPDGSGGEAIRDQVFIFHDAMHRKIKI
jgi:hypothetical protein